MNPSHGERRVGLIAFIAVIIIWSPSFTAIRVALRGFGPNEQALFRFILASALLAIPWCMAGRRIPERQDLPRIALTGALGVAGYQVLLGHGEQTVSASAAALLVATTPLFVVVSAAIFLAERPTYQGIAGIIIGFTGTAVISLAAKSHQDSTLGATAIVGAAICQALWVVFQKGLLARYRPGDLTVWTVWAGTALLIPFSSSAITEAAKAPLSAILAVTWLGAGSSAAGFLVFAAAVSRLPSTVAGSSFYLLPPGAVLTSWLWLGERLSAQETIGGLLSLIGVARVTHATTHKDRQATAPVTNRPPPASTGLNRLPRPRTPQPWLRRGAALQSGIRAHLACRLRQLRVTNGRSRKVLESLKKLAKRI